MPLTFDAEALMAAAAGRPPWPGCEAPLDEAGAAAERRRYLGEARALAAALTDRWKAEPPRWNVPTGDAFVDGLVWFRYVEAR